jgi:hypothetical protein
MTAAISLSPPFAFGACAPRKAYAQYSPVASRGVHLSSLTQEAEALAAEGARFAEFGRSRRERWIDSLDGDGLARLRWPNAKRLRARAD